MSNTIRVFYCRHPDITPEEERDLRARAWRYVFDCYKAKQKAGVSSTGNDGKEIKDVPDNPILPRRR